MLELMTTMSPARNGDITSCSDRYANTGIATTDIEYSADLSFAGISSNILAPP